MSRRAQVSRSKHMGTLLLSQGASWCPEETRHAPGQIFHSHGTGQVLPSLELSTSSPFKSPCLGAPCLHLCSMVKGCGAAGRQFWASVLLPPLCGLKLATPSYQASGFLTQKMGKYQFLFYRLSYGTLACKNEMKSST